jgi:hypoxanthine phosphoribosyltransferase
LVDEERILMDTYSYTFKEYESDIKSLRDTLIDIENIHLIAMYRGSIPIVVHLSNLLNCEMSIIKLEASNESLLNKEELKYEVEINNEGLDEPLSISKQLNEGMYLKRESYKPNPTTVPRFLSNNFKKTDNLVVIEDIYDTGKTIGLIQQLMKDEYSNHSVSYYSLFGKKNDVGVIYLKENNNKWIIFPWETIDCK